MLGFCVGPGGREANEGRLQAWKTPRPQARAPPTLGLIEPCRVLLAGLRLGPISSLLSSRSFSPRSLGNPDVPLPSPQGKLVSFWRLPRPPFTGSASESEMRGWCQEAERLVPVPAEACGGRGVGGTGLSSASPRWGGGRREEDELSEDGQGRLRGSSRLESGTSRASWDRQGAGRCGDLPRGGTLKRWGSVRGCSPGSAQRRGQAKAHMRAETLSRRSSGACSLS